jgi:ribosomal protein S18 acetylase RimI-like enzyme
MRSSDRGSVIIRSAARGDLAAIGKLGALLVRTHYEFDQERFLPATPETERAYASFLGSRLEQPNGVLLVAELGGEVLGYVWAGVEGYDYMALRGPAGVLYDILVDPLHRGHGIGSLLLRAAIGALEVRGAPRVVLSTAERNTSAQRLFERAGFRRTMIEMTREKDDISGSAHQSNNRE